MKSTLVLISLLACSIAHPHHHKRQDVAWATDNNYVTETIDITTTIWVQEGFVPLTVSSLSSDKLLTYSFQDSNIISTSSVAPPISPASSSSAYDCRVSASTLTPTTSATAASLYAPPVTSCTSISVAGVINYKSAPDYIPPEATTSSTLAPGATPSSSPSGECSSDSPCEGDITYYTAGLGACGSTSDGDTEKVAALPHGLMGPESNGNLYCGKTITITCIATGKTTTATVVDKCMGCDGFSVDLSNAAFLDLDDLAVGRTKATWYFN